MLLAVVVLKSLVEITLMVIFGRFVLGRLIGVQRQSNIIWQLLDITAKPALRLTRALGPGFILDCYIPWLAASWLAAVWLIALKLKIGICLQIGLLACKVN